MHEFRPKAKNVESIMFEERRAECEVHILVVEPRKDYQ